MKIKLSNHARARCRQRKIRAAEIKAVLLSPSWDAPSKDDPTRRVVRGDVNGRKVGVIVVEGTVPLFVVSVWAD